jgi:hypothetical protein
MTNPELPQRTTIMKHLLNGVAIAAVLALATPALAQNAPMTPSTPPAAAPAAKAPAPATSAPMKMPMAKKPVVHHMAMRHRPVGAGDQMTEQLNQQELARITGGAPPAPAPMPSNYQTPGKSDIAPAPGSMAPPPPAK